MEGSIKIAKKWEYASAILSTAWTGASIAVMVMLLVMSKKPLEYVCYSVYGGASILFYICSSIYYFIPNHKSGKLVFAHISHFFFILLIFGIYAPFCLLLIGGTFGFVLFGIVCAFAVTGITFRAIKCGFWLKYIQLIYHIVFIFIWTISLPKFIRIVNENGVIIYIVATLILLMSMVFFRISTKMQKRKAMAYRFMFNILFIISQICYIIFMFLYVRNVF